MVDSVLFWTWAHLRESRFSLGRRVAQAAWDKFWWSGPLAGRKPE